MEQTRNIGAVAQNITSNYRKLEYLYCNFRHNPGGGHYADLKNFIDTGLKPESNRFYYFDFSLNKLEYWEGSGTNYYQNTFMGCKGDERALYPDQPLNKTICDMVIQSSTDSETGQRVDNWVYGHWGRGHQASTLLSSTSPLNTTDKFEARMRIYSNGYSCWQSIYNLTTKVDNGHYWTGANNVGYVFDPSLMGNIRLMAFGMPDSTQLYFYQVCRYCYAYRFFVKEGSDSGTIINDMYPAQRKSDNKLGFYDTITHEFHELKGDTTSESAGPIVTETPGWY